MQPRKGHQIECCSVKMSNGFLLTMLEVQISEGGTFSLGTVPTFCLLMLLDIRKEMLLENIVWLIIPWQQLDWRLFYLWPKSVCVWDCSVGRVAFCRYFKYIVWSASFSNGTFLWLLLYDFIVCPAVCGSPLTKLRLRTYSSYKSA